MKRHETASGGLLLLERAQTARRAPRILLCEDDEAMRSLLEEVLEQEGYDVVLAEDGHELLERVAGIWLGEEGYDLVLSDIRMPGCTGLEALGALRKHDGVTRVVLMTAFGSPWVREQAGSLGATLVEKPFDVDRMVDRIRGLVPPTP